MKYFFGIINNIFKHPLTSRRKTRTVIDFLKWEFFSRSTGYEIVFPFIDDSKIIISNGMDGATGNIIFGLMEYNDMSFLLHFLRSSDTFVDVGANVGVYTILASGVRKAQTISIEPVPSTYHHLQNNITLNNIQGQVTAYNIGIGDKEGELLFSTSLDCVNHVVTDEEHNLDTVSVKVKRLDDLINEDSIPNLIKIDVEGYETIVLNGAEKLLKDSRLKGLIIELNGSGDRYGFDESLIHEQLLNLGFKPYDYDARQRILTEKGTFGDYNTIYLRDTEFISQRVKEAEPFKINKYSEFI